MNLETERMKKTAVVTGAGSGVGRSIALKLAEQDWHVALVGRREAALHETAQLSGDRRDALRVSPCDIGDPQAVAALGERLLAELGGVEALFNAAGTNAPRRALEVLSLDDYHEMLNANLNGAFYCVRTFLPGMRARGSGTIVNIVSDAGRLASAKAGPGYVVSKFGMVGLTQSINAEERARGIRACALLPGEINTPLLDKRPYPPDEASRARMLRPDDVADCALFCLNLPPHVIVEEMLVRPR